MNDPQQSDAWFASRLGKVTASKITDVLATVKTGEAVTRRNYRMQLACERFTGRKAESTYTNHHMERGNALEPLARALYELKKGVMVDEVGFVQHPTIEMAGASPDGLLEFGSIEIKCPTLPNHLEAALKGAAPSQYYGQMQWQLACLGNEYKFVDFVSYCPEAGEEFELFIVRVPRDNDYIQETEKAVNAFLQEVTETTNQLKEIKWL